MAPAILKTQSGRDNDLYFSVIIPAYNEERLLPATLTGLHKAMDSLALLGEVIVVDNNSTDNTAQIAKDHGARVVFEPFRQIAKARNRGAGSAVGSFLVFLDADTILSPQLLHTALNLLESGDFCGGGSLIIFDSKLPFLANILVTLWNNLSRRANLAAGSFIFCLARGFEEIGGFDEQTFAAEEISFSRRLKNWGRVNNLRFTIIRDFPVVTSGRKFHWYSSLRVSLLLFLFILFPPALRNRSLCSFWYTRPD
jgi:glycosyltransferase involved in cell wall biosynthesis